MNISYYVCLCLFSGRESRLPLTINGLGIGPQLQLNYNLIDLKNVSINSKANYEVTKLSLSEQLCCSFVHLMIN